jgi:hypothetical protein
MREKVEEPLFFPRLPRLLINTVETEMRSFRKKGWKLPRFCQYLLGNSAWSPICCWPHFPMVMGHFLVAFQHTQNCQKLFNETFRYFPAAFPHLLSNAQQLPNDLKGIVISCRQKCGDFCLFSGQSVFAIFIY